MAPMGRADDGSGGDDEGDVPFNDEGGDDGCDVLSSVLWEVKGLDSTLCASYRGTLPWNILAREVLLKPPAGDIMAGFPKGLVLLE